MSFNPLAKRLADAANPLPLVLCGPILRRVTPSSVTVWIATREAATVTLTVYEPGPVGLTQVLPAPATMTGAQRPTTAIGQNLHLVAVTARGPDATLKEGTIYTYDLSFTFTKSGIKKLYEATGVGPDLAEFSYGTFKSPTFALPPVDLEKLRIIHGSCRKPNGGGADALAMLDDLIDAGAALPLARPHQLFMTGDQIYADEVADILLLMLTDASETLLGWPEAMPTNSGVPVFAKSLTPGMRTDVIAAAKFSTDDKRSHLMSLGEYLAMYLFAWSPVLWPATLPIYTDLPTMPPDDLLPQDKRDRQQATVQNFAAGLKKVRRALANIPSYMICDDHEITDDWNMTREFCDRIYGDPLGMRVVQNGLVAYALCQAWGNTPEQFEVDSRNPAGLALLKLLDGGGAVTYSANAAHVQRIVGLHDATALKNNANTGIYGVFHEAGAQFAVQGMQVNDSSLNFHYSVEGPSYQIIVTDTRTWRQFPTPGKVTHPDLLSSGNIDGQIGGAPTLGNRLQLVIVTTNMPPIPPIRVAEEVLPALVPSKIYSSDLFDSWEYPSRSFDIMVTKLSDRLPLDTASPASRTGRIVILSGDVHTSYASRLAYWATKRFADRIGTSNPAKVVFAELVASPFKNETDDTLGQHVSGYDYVPKDLNVVKRFAAKELLPPKRPAGVFGWAVDPLSTQPVAVGTTTTTLALSEAQPAASALTVSGAAPSVTFDAIENSGLTSSTFSTITTPADYQYRAEQILATATGQFAGLAPTVSVVGPAGDAAARKAALSAYNTASGAYRNYKSTAGRGKEIVGRSNICEITFTWGADDAKEVHHTVRWYETKPQDSQTVDTTTVFWARYSVSLALNDTTKYGQLPFPPKP